MKYFYGNIEATQDEPEIEEIQMLNGNGARDGNYWKMKECEEKKGDVLSKETTK